jgi:hypothetical protein
MLAGFTPEQGSAIRITPVGEAALPGWLDAHPESREWTTRWKGRVVAPLRDYCLRDFVERC